MGTTDRNPTRARRGALAATAVVALGAGALAAPPARAADDPAEVGRFSAPFVEPDIYGVETDERCVDRSAVDPDDTSGTLICKPSAGSLVVLPDGDVLYWSALEATENVDISAVAEFGLVAENDQSRRLAFGPDGPEWRLPSPVDGGAEAQEPLPLVEIAPLLLDQGDGESADAQGKTNPRNADGAMFGSDQVFLADGRVLVASGTDYYSEFGAVELEGLRATRIYDPETDTWEATGDLANGRWYPTLVTLGDGRVLAFSGVQKLIKPVYVGEDAAKSGRNEVTVEAYDPDTGEWTQLPSSADRSLPLYPRLNLLPNGDIFFNTNGQTFNPFGQAYDQALWNVATVFDPDSSTWTDLGVPGSDRVADELAANGESAPGSLQESAEGIQDLAADPASAGAGGIAGATDPLVGEGDALDVGYRGSTFSVMLPLRPDADGRYRTVELLSAGGTVGPTPGSYVPVASSRITELTVDDDTTSMATRETEPLNRARWYGHGTVLPTGEVLVTSGGDRDHVLAPGSEAPITTPELFDPETETWTPVAEQVNPRTYHNSAALLPDGRVLVGGHNPIPTGYGAHRTLPGGFAPNDGRDPSFEIYSPPYLFRGDRPEIRRVPRTFSAGQTRTLRMDGPASGIEEVVAIRHTAETHIVDGDQRAVVLPVVERRGNQVTVSVPDADVLPSGPYMLFANRATDEGPVPSRAALITVDSLGAGDDAGEDAGGDDQGAPPAPPATDAVPTGGGAEVEGEAGDADVTASVTVDAVSATDPVPFDPAGSDGRLPVLPAGAAAVLVAAVGVVGLRWRSARR